MANSKKVKVVGSDRITKIKKEVAKPEKVSWEGIPNIKFLKMAHRNGRTLTFHSAWLQQNDAKTKLKELEVNGGNGTIVIHAKLGS